MEHVEEKENNTERERPTMIKKQGDQRQNQPQKSRSLTLDAQKYQAMLDHPGATQSQKAELIESLWTFVVSFMDLGYEIKTPENCGKQEFVLEPSEANRVPMLSCKPVKRPASAAFTVSAANKEVP